MKKYAAFFLYLYGMILLLPFLLTVLLSGSKALEGYVALEDRLLTLILAEQISWEAPEEALKAQAVLVRTNDAAAREEGYPPEARFQEVAGAGTSYIEYRRLLAHYPVYEKVMSETEEILVYEQKPRYVPYHQVSNGVTRDGKEVFHDDSHEYLVSVDSAQDRKAPSFGRNIFFPEDFEENIEIISRDSAGYVMEAAAGEEIFSGEELRSILNLPSSAFSLQSVEGRLKVFCKGAGHGLGLSQYGAGILAGEGQTYIEILNYYFPQMNLDTMANKKY